LPDPRNSAGAMPKCVVTGPSPSQGEGRVRVNGLPDFDWRDDRPPRTPWDRTVIYECHVKGMTMRHPRVEGELRGRYLGLASPPIVNHLADLGVTAIELLPIQYFVTERRLSQWGLVNYWGYNTIGFFAPHNEYGARQRPESIVGEFRQMVRTLHQAGIEVILDVVYNHTAESDERGPTLSFRGIDNGAYYHLDPNDRSRYLNYSGCGNSLNTLRPAAQQLIMDSLRYWVAEMHVDGFRFDLAPVLSRQPGGVDEHLRFFAMIRHDPVLAQVKLIVEPWDAVEGGFQLGRFPPGIAQWNSRYLDDVRRFWRGDAGQIAILATRLAGSSDILSPRSHGPCDGVNYVACHDGFTLHDLVSFNTRHNEANAEQNRDGPSENLSRNWGVEGPTDDPAVRAARERMKRSLLATLAFSQGVPMLTAGDEMGRTQRGNNNAYCQDNEVSWLDWNLDADQLALFAFVRRILALRREYRVLRKRRFFAGAATGEGDHKDVIWLDETGAEMTDAAWRDAGRRALVMLMNDAAVEAAPGGGRARVRALVLALNAGEESCELRLPRMPGIAGWREAINSARGSDDEKVGECLTLAAHSLVLLVSESV
ncbi:MAG: glycogen debranching protein GlgX, partial [Phycisphaerales bacterium]|nr:glycogen debranching protein GlgX [Phycisphaerales bacterium]